MMTDRFEQMVVKAGCYNDVTGPYTLTLLRREHAAVVRLVKKYRHDADAKKCGSSDELNIQLGRRYACDDILAALAKRKGTP